MQLIGPTAGRFFAVEIPAGYPWQALSLGGPWGPGRGSRTRTGSLCFRLAG